MPKPVVIFGAADIAELAHFYFTHDSSLHPAAFTVDAAYLTRDTFLDLPLVAFETVEETFPPDRFDMFVAIGYADINRRRRDKCAEGRRKGYTLASYISSKAILWPDAVALGDNCFIMEHNNIQPHVRIGNNVTLWSGNHIGHHSTIEDDCFIASHVVVSGGVTVGKGSFLGVNAALRDHITIGEHCVIGAGATILKNTEAYTVYTAPAARLLPMRSDELKHI